MMEERIERTFATPEGCDLVVENVRGEITVEGWDRSETEVVSIRRKGEVEIEIVQEGRKVIVRTKHERHTLSWLESLTQGGIPVVDYIVHVPFASDVNLKNVSGPIYAAQIQGQVQVNSVDGTANLRAISGKIKAETVNGTLDAAELEGTAKLSTVNGKMQVAGSVLEHLKASTVNGGIEIAATLADEGNYQFNTVNGSCHLTVQPAFRARVSAHGINMSVDCQVPNESVKRRFGNWEGTIGTGDGAKASIRFDTVNGRLRIDSGEATAGSGEFVAKVEPVPTPPQPPKPPEPPEPPTPPTEPVEVKVTEDPVAGKSQIEILQMVERGEISVEEAIKLIQEKE